MSGKIVLNSAENYIFHTLESNESVWSVIRKIINCNPHEETFYVCDVRDLIWKYENWRRLMPRVKTYYAVKCNDHPIVLRVFASLGISFDCASKNEIDKVLSLGVNPDRIIFANPTKFPNHVEHAAKKGVELMTFDNKSELDKIKEFYPKARLLLRFRCDDDGADIPLGKKFGCDPLNETAGLLQAAKDLDLDVCGVSFHVGYGAKSMEVYEQGVDLASKIFSIALSLGYKFKIVDLGGGYPGDSKSSLEQVAGVINSAIDKYFPILSGVEIIAEPGNYYVCSSFTLACKIISLREIPIKNGTQKHVMYYLDNGIYGSFNAAFSINLKMIPIPLKTVENGVKLYSSSIWGPSCDGLDVVVKETLLPELQVGDWLIFENMGAYTLTLNSPFNSFDPAKVYVAGNEECLRLFDCD